MTYVTYELMLRGDASALERDKLATTMSRAVGCVAPFCVMSVDVALGAAALNASTLGAAVTEQLYVHEPVPLT